MTKVPILFNILIIERYHLSGKYNPDTLHDIMHRKRLVAQVCRCVLAWIDLIFKYEHNWWE